MEKILNFRNRIQEALWNNELRGQISDGYWENASPSDHYVYWCSDVTVGVSPEDVGRSFYVRKDNYALTSKKLLDVVGDRMLVFARMARAGYSDRECYLAEYLYVTCEGIETPLRFFGLPTYEGEYWDRLRAEIFVTFGEDLSGIRAIIEDEEYGARELRAELRDMKEILSTRI